MSGSNTSINKVTYWWDDQPYIEPGWYLAAFRDETLIMDSTGSRFPVKADDFKQNEEEKLLDQLRLHFPRTLIVKE